MYSSVRWYPLVPARPTWLHFSFLLSIPTPARSLSLHCKFTVFLISSLDTAQQLQPRQQSEQKTNPEYACTPQDNKRQLALNSRIPCSSSESIKHTISSVQSL